MIHSSSSLLISCDFQILPLPLPSGCHGWFIFHPINDNDAIWPACFSGGMVQPPTIRSLLVQTHTYRHILHCITLHYITYITYITLHTLHTLHTYHTYIPCIHAMHTYHSFIHSYIHTYIRHTYIHTYLLTYLHTYILTYILTYVHTYIHTYIQTYIHTYNILYIYTYMCARVKSCYYYMFIPTFRVSLWSN